jgi:hypothetical protein
VDEYPQNSKIVLPNNSAEFTYTFKQIGQTIQIISKLKVNKIMFYTDEYANLREFYNLIIQKHKEQIVFKKA